MRQTERRESVSVGSHPRRTKGMNARRPDPMITMLRIPRRLEVRPVGAARQLFQRAQSLVVHILDADLRPQRREVALLMPQLDPGTLATHSNCRTRWGWTSSTPRYFTPSSSFV